MYNGVKLKIDIDPQNTSGKSLAHHALLSSLSRFYISSSSSFHSLTSPPTTRLLPEGLLHLPSKQLIYLIFTPLFSSL